MNVLFLTVAINDMNGNGLYTDLLRTFRDKGHDVYVICPTERRNKESTRLVIDDDIKLLNVRTGNITKTNFIEKGISTILIENQFISAIKRYFKDVKFDLLLYTTPPVTFYNVIRYIKTRDNCVCYLILKDIFPQNALDLQILKPNSFVYKYFKIKEKNLYKISDYIGCTSKGNVDYIIKHNEFLDPKKVELFPNSILPRQLSSRKIDRNLLREKYEIPIDSVVFIYGGNIGRPQGIDFIKEVILKADEKEDFFIMIFGSGTEFDNLSSFISKSRIRNVKILRSIPNNDFWEFLVCCDVGLIFLDKRFTVPNTPARLTYYMESALPILAATDKNTDIKQILSDANCGYWVESSNVHDFYSTVDKLLYNQEIRKKLGKNAREYLEKNWHIINNYETIMNHLRIGD